MKCKSALCPNIIGKIIGASTYPEENCAALQMKTDRRTERETDSETDCDDDGKKTREEKTREEKTIKEKTRKERNENTRKERRGTL